MLNPCQNNLKSVRMRRSKPGRIQLAPPVYSSIRVQALSRQLGAPGMTPGDRLCNLRWHGSRGTRTASRTGPPSRYRADILNHEICIYQM